MGLPIGQLIVATNENDVLDEFFKTGGYHPRGLDRTYETTSPSMDITKASNLERFVFDLIGRDAERLAAMWKSVETGSGFELTADEFATMRDSYGFKSEASNHADRIAHIREVFEKYGVQVDPHTADGFKAAKAHRNPAVPMVIMETALPAKFEDTMQEALKQAPFRPKGLAGLEALPQRFDAIEADAALIKQYLVERIK
jgi:threonine synthase